MSGKDVRWIQRLSHFSKALAQLRDAVELSRSRPLSSLEEQGMIKAFELAHELAWNTMKDFLESRGVQNLFGSKDATREAFKAGLISDGEAWMDMIRNRNLTSHTYDEETASGIASAVKGGYIDMFEALATKLEGLKKDSGA